MIALLSAPRLWLILAAVLAWGASVTGAFFYGQDVGKNDVIATQKVVEDAVAQTRLAAQEAAATEIAKIKPRNVTIKQEVEREVRTNTVYTGCRLPPVGMRLANEALTGQRAQPPGDSELPGAEPPDGQRDGSPAEQTGGGGKPVP